MLTGLSEEQLKAVIAHELAHSRRLDCFANLFQIAAETLLFYHPAIWWVNKRIRSERENCCDDVAIFANAGYEGDVVLTLRQNRHRTTNWTVCEPCRAAQK
ncbi:MAG TPA: M56 family metallopeptidase [Candidatus Acidoferrales bacterium]|nr:M56 family metallopeptidase [Candidatus Acidoferrales bacterium]